MIKYTKVWINIYYNTDLFNDCVIVVDVGSDILIFTVLTDCFIYKISAFYTYNIYFFDINVIIDIFNNLYEIYLLRL